MKSVIVIVSIIAFLSIAGTIIIGKQSFEGVVTDKPYDRGLQWDREQNERRASGWSVDLGRPPFKVGKNDLFIKVLDKNNNPINNAQIALSVSRPASAAYDRKYDTARSDEGKYNTSVDLPLYGHWDIKVFVTREGHSINFAKKIFAEQ